MRHTWIVEIAGCIMYGGGASRGPESGNDGGRRILSSLYWCLSCCSGFYSAECTEKSGLSCIFGLCFGGVRGKFCRVNPVIYLHKKLRIFMHKQLQKGAIVINV